MQIDPAHPAVALIEFQNQWTAPGVYHTLIRRQLESRNVVANTLTVVHAARAAGVRVVHAPLVLDPHHKRGWLAHLTGARFFTKGTPRAAFTPGVYADGDLLVQGRYVFDPFIGSDFADVLRQHDIRSVLFTGFITDQCPSLDLRTALQHGFEGFLVADCTATMTRWQQQRTEAKWHRRTVRLHEVLNAFALHAPAARTATPSL